MAFPNTPLGVMVELYIGGVWVDITGDVYTNNLITITRGRQDEASRTDAGTCVFVLDNSTGRYSSRNPRSDLFGLIGRNTPVRVSIQPGGATAPRLVRFVGEVSSWPPKWSTARYVTVTASAAGILRRLGQGATPLASPMRREFASPTRTSIVAYWPLEDGSTATEYASALPGASPMIVVAEGAKPGAYTAYEASEALPTLGTGQFTGSVPAYTDTGETALRFFAAFPDTPLTADAPILDMRTTTGMRFVLAWEGTTGVLSISSYAKDGTRLEYHAITGNLAGRRLSIGLDLTQSGTEITRRLYVIDVDEYTLVGGGLVPSIVNTFTGTVGRVTTITLGGGAAGDVVVGHVALADSRAAYGATGSAMIGYAGEGALSRIVRLCAEEGIPLTARGVADLPSSAVGTQSVAALLDLLQESVEADGGRLYEQRDALGLALRTRATLYTQPPKLTLDYSAAEVAEPFEPVDDDQHVQNDVTIVRKGGSSARAVAETGPLSVEAPPNGVGRYSGSTTLNLFADEQCSPHAYWHLHKGTRDAPRYPSAHVEVHNAPHLAEQVAAVDVGDRAVIANPPPWLPPEQIELLVEGYTETLGVHTWDVTFNASPGGVYLVGMADDTEYGRADTDATELAQPATDTATELMVRATEGGTWDVDPGDLPFPVTIGGEELRVDAVGPAAGDTFTRAVAGGWGPAESGQAWQVSGLAPGSHYAVNGSAGLHSIGTRNTYYVCSLPSLSLDDVEMVATFTMPIAPTGDGVSAFVMLRTDAAATSFYMARVYFNTSGTAQLSLRKRTPTETVLATYATALAHTAGTSYTVRLRVEGSTLAARFWKTGEREPSGWQVTATDTDIPGPGGLGVRSFVTTGNTNTLPVVVAWDDVAVTDVQKLTVTRARNNIAKAHPQGAAVSLTHPAFTAL
ncbi:hypothetical protein [Streptomyces nigra]|uniref:hypothetical protein n=1 Tax=Streptomyces nigra TaxID=1827580 RepID=UPI0037F16FF2